jgi:geranylgeranyl pyrophosphate synthase
MLDHILDSIGKGTRPAITLLASKFHPHDPQPPILMASAVELLHLATLIHDDTVDNADIRRGRPTVSSRWGEKMAVLLGDYVFAKSATLVCATQDIRVVRIFSETIMDLSSGELKERFAAYDWTVGKEQYWDRISQKTASLFCTAAKTGAILSGASESVVETFHTYGHSLGMAFQIVDDILDFQGTESEVGKPVGSDLAQGVLTLPAILLQEKYPQDNPIKELFENQGRKDSLEKAVEMINSSSVIDDSYATALEYCSQARKALEPLPDNVYRRSLMELPAYVLERKK